MRKQYIHKTTILRLCVGIAAMTGMLAAAANASPMYAGRFTLPYEVHWGGAVLPPGDYVIRMDTMTALPVISSSHGDMAVFTQVPTIADSSEADGFITITNNGDERRVRTLNLPELKKVAIFVPITKQEKETLAKAGSIKTVPVVSAKR